MNDSSGRDPLEATRERRRAERLEGVKRWVRHLQETPPEQWGPEQNAVVNAQVEAARAADLDADHRLRVERLARELGAGTDDFDPLF